MQTRTDTRPLAERKASVTMRIAELRKALAEAERCAAEIEERQLVDLHERISSHAAE